MTNCWGRPKRFYLSFLADSTQNATYGGVINRYETIEAHYQAKLSKT
jgi:hypothetical protein